MKSKATGICIGSIIFMLLFWGKPAWASLEWETSEITLEADGAQPQITTLFKCRNAASYSVSVTQSKASSPQVRCYFHSMGRSSMEPDARGWLTATFRNQGVFSEQRYVIEVRTDDRKAPTYELTLRVVPKGWDKMTPEERALLASEGASLQKMPAPLTLSSRALMWSAKQLDARQEIVVTVNGDDQVRVLGLEPGDLYFKDAFDVTVTEEEPSRRYRVIVQPRPDAMDKQAGTPPTEWRLKTTMNRQQALRQLMHGETAVYLTVQGEMQTGLSDSRTDASSKGDQ